MRPLRGLRLDPRGPGDRPHRDRRRVEPRHRRHPRPPGADQLRPDRPQAQGLHPRRGPPDHEGRLERAPEVARGAARLRDVHVRLDPPPGLPAGDPVAPPALRRPAPDRARDRGQAPDGSSRPSRSRPSRRRSTSSPASRPAGCATPSRCSTSCSRRRAARSTRPTSATCSGWPTPTRSMRLVAALVDGDAAAGIAVLDELEDRGRDLGVVLDQVGRARPDRVSPPRSPTDDAAADTPRLTRAARRLAAIDPERRGVGGLRLQVELALFVAPTAQAAPSASPPRRRPPARASATRAPAARARAGATGARRPPLRPSVQASEPDARAASAEPEPEPAAAAPARSPSRRRRPRARAGAARRNGARRRPPPSRPPRNHPPPHPPQAPTSTACSRTGRRSSTLSPSRHPRGHHRVPPDVVDGNVVTLGFPEAKAFLKDVAERKRADPRGRRRRLPRAPGQRPLRRDEHRPRPGGQRRRRGRPDLRRGEAHLRGRPGRRRRGQLSRRVERSHARSARLRTAGPPQEAPQPWAWATFSGWPSRCSRRWSASRASSRR